MPSCFFLTWRLRLERLQRLTTNRETEITLKMLQRFFSFIIYTQLQLNGKYHADPFISTVIDNGHALLKRVF